MNNMPLKNSASRFGSVAKLFHWGIALLLIAMFMLGFIMVNTPLGMEKLIMYGRHKSLGVMVLVLMVLRLLWRLSNPVPHMPGHMSATQRFLAHASHFGLYVLVLAMPLSGWLMSSAAGLPVSVFGWFTLPIPIAPDKDMVHLFKGAHEYIAWTLLVLIALHITAALVHHFYYKDDVLLKMLPQRKSK
jgi:cytochrome b561